MIEEIPDNHIGIITFERRGARTFCCPFHERFWDEEQKDLLELNRIEYRSKYGMELFDGVKKSDKLADNIRDKLNKFPTVKVPFMSTLERRPIL